MEKIVYSEDKRAAYFDGNKFRRDAKTGNVGESLEQTNIPRQDVAPESADVSFAAIKTIKRAGKEPVYNMEVDGVHNFSVNGGIVVHNCVDALRYFVNYLPDWRFEGV